MTVSDGVLVALCGLGVSLLNFLTIIFTHISSREARKVMAVRVDGVKDAVNVVGFKADLAYKEANDVNKKIAELAAVKRTEG